MKKIFIELRKKSKKFDPKPLRIFKNKTISLASTIQYLNLLDPVKKELEKNNKVKIKKGAYYKGHVIGCNASAFDKDADILLLLADGKFHASNLSIILRRPIKVFNTRSLSEFSKEDLNKALKEIEQKKRKFLLSKKIGLIISQKPGQKTKNITNIAKKIEKLDKKVYLFEADSININELENFPEIKIWVNTACPGLEFDSQKIINLKNIIEFLK